MKVISPLVAVCTALATLTITPIISATPIRVIDASSLVGTPFDPNPNANPPPAHHHSHSHSHAQGVPIKLDEEAEKSVKGWMDFFEKYALGVSGMKKDGDGQVRYGAWREGKIVHSNPWDKNGPGYVHQAAKHPEDKPPHGHHHDHHHHGHEKEVEPESESGPEAFHILPHTPNPRPGLPNWILSPLSSLESNNLPTIIKPHHHTHPNHHGVSEGLALPHEGVEDEDWKAMLVKAGIIRPEEAGNVVVKHVEGVPAVGVGMYRGKWYGHGQVPPTGGPRPTARCFFGRLSRAINNLHPYESFLISFIFGMGLASLLRFVYMIILLVKRSHQYVNEIPREVEGRGYPGAEARMRRERERVEREREELLPAYVEKVEEDEQEKEEKKEEQTTGH